MTAGRAIPFLDLKRINDRIRGDIEAALIRVVASGRYLLSEENAAFAREFGAFVGRRRCVPVGNGLDALRLALRAWMSLGRLTPGDEVVVPANSFIASAFAVTEAGLGVVLADVAEDTMCLNVATVRAARTSKTRVVMPVHLYGQSSDIEHLTRYARDHGLLVLEDAAQAHGGAVGGRRLGAFGDAAAFSFYPAKNLGALGDAGCVVTDDAAFADEVATLGNYGSTRKYHHERIGTNSRMDETNAAVLRVKLATLDSDNARRRSVAGRYAAGIRHPEVFLPVPPVEPKAHVWHLYVIRTGRRASLVDWLASAGVETLIHYPTVIHRQPAYANLGAKTLAPVAERLQSEVLSLPISPVMADEDVEYVIASINAWPAAGGVTLARPPSR